MVLLQIQEWLTDANAANNTTLQLVAATLYLHDDNIKEAIRILHHGLNMEQNAVLVQLYLRCDRLDLAQKQVKAMKAVDEDGTLGMLATAWTLLHVVLDINSLAFFIYKHNYIYMGIRMDSRRRRRATSTTNSSINLAALLFF